MKCTPSQMERFPHAAPTDGTLRPHSVDGIGCRGTASFIKHEKEGFGRPVVFVCIKRVNNPAANCLKNKEELRAPVP
jgi:hypothetical protein